MDNEQLDDQDQTQELIAMRQKIRAELTQICVGIFEQSSQITDKNQALGVVIESLSETLGNMISLVKEDFQQEVISSANDVIQQGLISQQEMIAEMVYGQIGHA